MKKMMIALMAVLITVALAGIGTYAYFSDTATSEDNTFTAGTMDFIILAPGGNHQVFNVANMKPGGIVTGYMVIANNSAMDMKWKAWLSGTVGGTLGEVLKIQWTMNPSDYNPDLTGYTEVPSPADYVVGSPPGWTAVSDLTGDNTHMVWAPPGTVAFASKMAAVYKIEVKMDETAGNAYQGLSYVGDLIFYATQWENSGW